MTMMEERYHDYLARFGLAYSTPQTYEEFEADTLKADAEKTERQKRVQSLKEAMENPYTKYTKEARAYDEYDDENRHDIIKEMARDHKEKINELYKERKVEEAAACSEYFEAARAEIKAKKRQRKRVSPLATNVYDDDDNPTTY